MIIMIVISYNRCFSAVDTARKRTSALRGIQLNYNATTM